MPTGTGSQLGAVIAGLINSGQSLPTLDIQSLLNTITNNQNNNSSAIGNLSPAVQQLLQQYQTSSNNAMGNATTGTNAIGNNLLGQTSNLYSPTSPAVQATLAALKQQDYSTQPGTINALKSNLAATGGLQRGGAATALTKATLAPAAQYSQQSANVTGQQLNEQQQAVSQALSKIASMDDATLQQVLGMSQQQANQILTTGNQTLQTQLAALINNNNFATNATLGAQNSSIAGNYLNGVARNANQAGIVNGLGGLAGTIMQDTLGNYMGGGAGAGGTEAAMGGGDAELGSMADTAF